jgi:2-dehydro-3-deoxyglucarate aldolase/4-hydroxy-2-oxoheptanedioate aldolase
MASGLKELLRQERVLRIFCLGQLCSPKFVEIIALHGGFDAVWLDLEHGGLSIADIEHAARAARGAGIESFVRLAPTDYASVMRPLEAGAGGIMAAQVRSARQTEEIVRWTKFHPRGIRGINNTGFDGAYCTTPLAEYLQESNSRTFIAVQIENQDAVEEVEGIAAVPDIDLLFIGPADLSQALGIPGEWEHPLLWKAIERVARAARSGGVAWAILPPNVEIARRCVQLGCRMLSVGIDVWAVQRGLKAFLTEFGNVEK